MKGKGDYCEYQMRREGGKKKKLSNGHVIRFYFIKNQK